MRVSPFLAKVALRTDIVGYPPGDVAIASEHDRRHAGVRHAGLHRRTPPFRCTSYQHETAANAMCGSLATIGSPELSVGAANHPVVAAFPFLRITHAGADIGDTPPAAEG